MLAQSSIIPTTSEFILHPLPQRRHNAGDHDGAWQVYAGPFFILMIMMHTAIAQWLEW